jgi:hypothetical protein
MEEEHELMLVFGGNRKPTKGYKKTKIKEY